MAIIKSFTDVPQSKKLVEILPIESADMYYQYVLPKLDKIKHTPEIGNPVEALEWYNKGYTHFGKEPLSLKEYCIPCWSLAALFSMLPKSARLERGSATELYGVSLPVELKASDWYINPVDACYEMIIRLHEEKLL